MSSPSSRVGVAVGALVVFLGALWWLVSVFGCAAESADVPVSIDDDESGRVAAEAQQVGARQTSVATRRETGDAVEVEHEPSGIVRVRVTDSFGRALLDGQAAVSLDVRKAGKTSRRRFLIQPIRSGFATFEGVPLGQEMVVRAHAERARIGVDPSLPSQPLEALEVDGEERSVAIAVELTRPWLRIRAPFDAAGRSQPIMHLMIEDAGRGHFRAAQRPDEDGWMSVMLPERFVGRRAAGWLTLGPAATTRVTFLGDLGPFQIGANTEVHGELLTPLVLVSGRVDVEALTQDGLEIAEPGDVEVRIERSSDGSRWTRIQRDFAWAPDDRLQFSFSWVPRSGDRHRLQLLVAGGPIGDPVEFEPFETGVVLPAR